MTCVCRKPFFCQPSIAYPALLDCEELIQHDIHDGLLVFGAGAHFAVNPSPVVRQAASRRAPAKAQKAVVCPVFGKCQVCRVCLEIVRV